MCACVCTPAFHVCAVAHRGQKRALDPLEVELQVVMSIEEQTLKTSLSPAPAFLFAFLINKQSQETSELLVLRQYF